MRSRIDKHEFIIFIQLLIIICAGVFICKNANRKISVLKSDFGVDVSCIQNKKEKSLYCTGLTLKGNKGKFGFHIK